MNIVLKTRSVIFKTYLLILYVLLFCFIILGDLSSCGGGGGYKVNKRIIVNTIGINKETIILSNNTVQEKYDLLYKNGNDKFVFYRTIQNKQFVNQYSFVWNRHKYFVACLLGGDQWSGGVGIFDFEGMLLKFIETPRYCTGAIAMPVTIVDQDDMLAIFILQQTTSRSSTLFILDSKWDIAYKEYLSKGKWFGKMNKRNKGFILVEEDPDRKSEIAWFYF